MFLALFSSNGIGYACTRVSEYSKSPLLVTAIRKSGSDAFGQSIDIFPMVQWGSGIWNVSGAISIRSSQELDFLMGADEVLLSA
jgi:hypothetical protein